ncbi:MAG: sigma-54 dependent transcriptional regulator [Saprospiraceae bacterium]
MENLQSVKQRYGIIGRSSKLDRALSTALRVAKTDLSILITGESGTGKEAFSKIIHDNSARKHNKFIAINCGAIPEGTINSELFGHEKGAFTGATGERKGYFEAYDGGTIFLDEIGEMPLDTQASLLRILEIGEFIRVGSSKPQKTDVRILAATNVQLDNAIRKGKFREDLYYRLNTVPIELPSLRERPEDTYMLFRKFAVDFAEKYRTPPVQLNENARALLEKYNWPGNIRELKNVAEQISVLSEERLVTAEHLLELIPNIMKRNLPMIPEKDDLKEGGLKEREILYKVLFEMKKDLTDLKGLVFDIIRNNNLQVPNMAEVKSITSYTKEAKAPSYSSQSVEDLLEDFKPSAAPQKPNVLNEDKLKPIILDEATQQHYQDLEVIDDNLSLIENEKELIRKALKKHQGKRKEAAQDLEISERTLYRKIKEYDL